MTCFDPILNQSTGQLNHSNHYRPPAGVKSCISLLRPPNSPILPNSPWRSNMDAKVAEGVSKSGQVRGCSGRPRAVTCRRSSRQGRGRRCVRCGGARRAGVPVAAGQQRGAGHGAGGAAVLRRRPLPRLAPRRPLPTLAGAVLLPSDPPAPCSSGGDAPSANALQEILPPFRPIPMCAGQRMVKHLPQSWEFRFGICCLRSPTMSAGWDHDT